MTRAKTVNENVHFEKGQDPKEAMGIGGEDKKLMKMGVDALTHFMYYVDVRNMINEVWNGWDHIEEKIKKHMGNSTSIGPDVLMKFIRDLDTENQDKLYNYIIKNHTNKW